jgi:hypothetical protein
MGRRLVNFTLLVLLGPILFTFAYEGVLFVLSVFTLAAAKWFLLGAGVSLVVHLLLMQDSIRFLEILMHEVEHAAVVFFLTFQLPTRMEINTQGRSVVEVPDRGGCLTTLAPYYLPLLTLPPLLVKALAAPAFSRLGIDFPTLLALVLDVLIGGSLAFHMVTTCKEMRPAQSDLREVGLLNSLVAVLLLNLMFLVLIIAVVTGSYEAYWAYVKDAAGATVGAYQAAYASLTERLLPALGDLVQRVVDWICDRGAPALAP